MKREGESGKKCPVTSECNLNRISKKFDKKLEDVIFGELYIS